MIKLNKTHCVCMCVYVRDLISLMRKPSVLGKIVLPPREKISYLPRTMNVTLFLHETFESYIKMRLL